MKKKLVLYFPGMPNDIFLKKDVGLFPIFLKKYFSEVEIIYIHQSASQKLPSEYRGIKNTVIGNVRKYQYGRISKFFQLIHMNQIACNYISANKDITHFMLFHWTNNHLNLIRKLKKINPELKIYLKLDCSNSMAERMNKDILHKSLRGRIFGNLIDKCLSLIDLLSTETQQTFNILCENKKIASRLALAFNGYDDYLYIKPNTSKKEKTIITVGRLGTAQKNTNLFLEVIKRINLNDWTIKLIGSIEKSFKNDIDNFYRERPDLQGKVVFTGAINDTQKILDEYQKASVFVLTSRWESCALVLLEAAINGCCICTTNVGIAQDLKYSWICPNSSENKQNHNEMVNHFSKRLQTLIDNQNLCFENFDERNEFYKDNFMMSKVVDKDFFRVWSK